MLIFHLFDWNETKLEMAIFELVLPFPFPYSEIISTGL